MTVVRKPIAFELVPLFQRILLVHAAPVDIRLPWASWQQPTGLLRIGSALRSGGSDSRLIDCLQACSNGRLTRERVGRLQIEERKVDLWRFGLSPSNVASRLRDWAREGWHPDCIYISCAVSTWWQGARDLIRHLKATDWSNVPIVLGGAYPTFYPDHAAAHTQADEIAVGDIPTALSTPPDLTLYRPGRLPRFAGIHLYEPSGLLSNGLVAKARSPDAVATQVAELATLGVTTVAFFDSWLGPAHRDALAAALDRIATKELRGVRFVAVGNFSPRLIDDDLAVFLRRTRFRNIYLHDDVEHTADGLRHLTTEAEYAACVRALHKAGFRPRTDEVGASVLVGIPGEDLQAVAKRLVRLASIVGSVNLVPYQYTPGTPEGKVYDSLVAQRNGHLDPTTLNAQLFPLARLAGARFEDYVEITRLAALLNSKFRSQTFDFLSDSRTARMVRKSLAEELWNPFRDRGGKQTIMVLRPVHEGVR